MKYKICLIMLSQLLTVLLLGGSISPVLAAPAHTTALHRGSLQLHQEQNVGWSSATRRRHRFWYAAPVRTSNQVNRNCSRTVTHKSYRGSGQGNDGNHGYNSGETQDNSSNSGNQIMHQRGWGYRQRNQFVSNCSTNSTHLFFQGRDQGNDGNQGFNRGNTMDNSSNSGNQAID